MEYANWPVRLYARANPYRDANSDSNHPYSNGHAHRYGHANSDPLRSLHSHTYFYTYRNPWSDGRTDSYPDSCMHAVLLCRHWNWTHSRWWQWNAAHFRRT